MRIGAVVSLFVSTVFFSGCASITGDTVQSMRVEARLADGTEIQDAECELVNEYGSFRVKTPGSVSVRRSATDLHLTCSKEGQNDARGVAVSRANSGMWGNIIFGGGVGAIIDHNKGTAYTYPQWVQLVIGKLLRFDRSDDSEGQPSLASEIGNRESTSVTSESRPLPGDPPVSLAPSPNKAL